MCLQDFEVMKILVICSLVLLSEGYVPKTPMNCEKQRILDEVEKCLFCNLNPKCAPKYAPKTLLFHFKFNSAFTFKSKS